MARQRQAPHQLDLLPPPPLLPATEAFEHLKALGQRLPRGLHLGTSSWSFTGWQNLVYGGKYTPTELSQNGLRAYSQHPLLRTVGIDSAHYQPLPEQTLRAYAAQTPGDFQFLMKAHEACTLAWYPQHKRYGTRAGQANPLFLDAAYAAQTVVTPWVEAMQERAGVLLFQFAAQDVRMLGGPLGFAKRLATFMQSLPKGPLYAVELRNVELLTPAYGRALADHGAVHCFNAHPSMPPVSRQQRAMGNPSWQSWVVRWMLQEGLKYKEAKARYSPFATMHDPDPQTRTQIAKLVRYATGIGAPVFVIVNNKAEGCAPLSIAALAAEI